MSKILFIIASLWGACLGAQPLQVMGIDDLPRELRRELQSLEGEVADSIDFVRRSRRAQALLQDNGYLLSEAHLSRAGETLIISIDAGARLYARAVELIKPPDFIIPERQAPPDRQRLISRGGVSLLADQELKFLENHGYPFAQIRVSSFEISNDSVSVSYEVAPGPRVSIDSIVVKGFQDFPNNFLRYDLELRKGMAYNEALLNSLPERTGRVEYLRMTRKPALAFTRNRTVLYLYLEEVRGNQVDGVLGINTTPNGEVSFNGDFHLRLLNTIKKGEHFELRWRRPDQSVQSFDLGLGVPYLLRSPVGMTADLSIFRQDSSFVNTGFRGALEYLIQSGSAISAGINLKSSNVLNDGNAAGFNSFSTVLYQLGIRMNRTNRVVIPTRGYRWMAAVSTGNRRTGDNAQDQYALQVDAQSFYGLKNHVLAVAVKSQALFGENLFLNEVYRIGGLKTLRGFNEQSIFSSAYTIGTLEYRYMIGEFDYLTVFTDVAWSETNTINEYASNLFTGIGTGINFNTAGGIFSLFFALGKDQDAAFDFRTAKVHFGYASRF